MRGVEFSLTLADVPEIPTHCPVFPWIELRYTVGERGAGKSKNYFDAPSLDRINNTRGYVPGNIRIISDRANVLKSDATPEELFALAADAERYYGSFFPADEPTPDGSFEEIFKENENKA